MKARITARKYLGDDALSWAVFVDGRPFATGLSKREVPHYQREAARRHGLEAELARKAEQRKAARERHWRRTGVSEDRIAWMKRTGSL